MSWFQKKQLESWYQADDRVRCWRVSQMRSSPSAELQATRAWTEATQYGVELIAQAPKQNQEKKKVWREYPENRMGLEGWKQMSTTEARWPRSTATGSGGGLLLILPSSNCNTTQKIGFQALLPSNYIHLIWGWNFNCLASLFKSRVVTEAEPADQVNSIVSTNKLTVCWPGPYKPSPWG